MVSAPETLREENALLTVSPSVKHVETVAAPGASVTLTPYPAKKETSVLNPRVPSATTYSDTKPE